MKVIIKELTYEFDGIIELDLEIQNQEKMGWYMRSRNAVTKNVINDKFNSTIKYYWDDIYRTK